MCEPLVGSSVELINLFVESVPVERRTLNERDLHSGALSRKNRITGTSLECSC